MPAAKAAPVIAVRQPYPGLRPFEPDDAIKFYGREPHTADLVRRLAENRFVAVVGSSGSGKSSLVKAGLLPALYLGRMIGATSQWRISIMRPGDAPLLSLADSLAEIQVWSNNPGAVLETVSRSSQGLLRAVRDSHLVPGESVLLVVDQFEELFRFRQQDGGAEARLFVASLLEATQLSSAPVYVVLTMRSDFLGDCSQFPGLPEALNRSQYLIPRMTREQLREAIEKPLRLVNVHMSDRLVEQLLNELGGDTGQLPVLQHALNRTFHEFSTRGGGDEIGIPDYVAAGEMRGALNAHAEAVLHYLCAQDHPEAERWTERVFRCLTTSAGGRKIRRPTRLDRLFEIVGAGDEDAQQHVRRVIGAYSDPDNAMLFWSGAQLTGDSVVDIAHESLIQHWGRLKSWVEIEADAARLYRSAAMDAVRKRREAAAKWRGTKLAEALALLEQGPWSPAWAARLAESGASFAEVRKFVKGEAAAQNTEEQDREAQLARQLELERQAKEVAEARWKTEMRIRQEAEKVQAARKAQEAAESAVRAERRKRRWLSAGLVMFALAIAVLILLLKIISANSQLLDLQQKIDESQKRPGETTDVTALISSADTLLKEIETQEQDLSSQVLHEPNSSKKRDLATRLANLQARQGQVQASKRILQSRHVKVNPVDGLNYVFIPAGTFLMGCSPGDDECDDEEKPPRAVQISNGFWLGQTEVTQAAWQKVMRGDNPSNITGEKLPVENIDWNAADAYCKAVGGRLPAEPEWEYAARGGTTAARYGPLDDVAWYKGDSNSTQEVGQKQANPFGIYDMLGNVWEWTADSHAGHMVARGGSWLNGSESVRASVRSDHGLTDRDRDLGFRCVAEFR